MLSVKATRVRNGAAMLDGKSLKRNRKAGNGVQTSKSKGDGKTYK